MFAKGKEYELARLSFMKCYNWQQAFCMAAKLQFHQAQTKEMANKIAGRILLLIRALSLI